MDTTFANASVIDEDKFNDYLRPSAEWMTEALTFAFLTPQLRENPAVPPEWSNGELFIEADPSALIADPSTEEHAKEVHAVGAISDAALRRETGFTEDDAPEPLELVQRAGLRRGIFTASITAAMLEALDAAGFELPETVTDDPMGPPPSEGGDEAVQAAAQAVWDQLVAGRPMQQTPVDAIIVHDTPELPAVNPGRDLMLIDRELRARLVVAADDSMTRALERASNRLKSRTNGTPFAASLKGVKVSDRFAHLGPSLVAQALGDSDPLDGAWDALEEQFMAWGAQAQDQAIDAASKIASGMSDAQRKDLMLRQADDLGEAWGWMKEALTSLADRLLYDPNPAAPDLGEFDPTLKVPTGLVRQAISRAGGAAGLAGHRLRWRSRSRWSTVGHARPAASARAN